LDECFPPVEFSTERAVGVGGEVHEVARNGMEIQRL
jgi:hypothetical protein